MRILLINTAGAEGSAALADTEAAQPILAKEMMPGRTSSERLVPTIRRLLEAQLWRLGDLAAIGVVHGPGSFTGVRVGISAAKGLSDASGVKLVAVSRLALLASSVDGQRDAVYPVLDAGRGEFYFGEYVGQRCVREGLISRENLMSAAASEVVVVCEAKVAEALAALTPKMVIEPKAADVLSLVIKRIKVGQFDDASALDANYLRRTDSEIFAKPASKA
jgi:tRNA threonylcarbamoyladenosine biosynthesis protein TsaB